MLTLFHAPMSRSSRMLWLLEELGAEYEVRYVSIRRGDGSGGPDEANPHPHKQVPALLHGKTLITESSAITLYLTDLFPDSLLGRPIGHAERGPYLSWLAYYSGVVEPVATMNFMGLTASNPQFAHVYEDMAAHVIGTLTQQPYLLGERISAADILLGSALGWMRRLLPESDAVDRYVATVNARPALTRAREIDSKPDGFHD
ncbi:glutathione S-transferase family protein [Pararhizobium arenae]|uniref:glutathione S-transferase family protein n=1 Tax=Pararhizobium arenae TaxID=1856850 RepID=UPI00094B262B|nr:glutathione S-transferase family protein [Pararhizobium arenae]